MRRLPCYLRLIAGAVLVGCGSQAPVEPDRRSPADPGVVAVIDGDSIRDPELDASLRIDLYELDAARYRLRAKRLDTLIEARVGKAAAHDEKRVERRMVAPQPPRLEIDVSGAPVRGRADAPIVLVHFIDYESTHARRMQPVLVEILERYQESVRLVVRDLPLPFHRHARDAARAAHCAAEQDAYWRMHDAMFMETRGLSRERLEVAARRTGIEIEAWRECVNSGRHAQRVAAGVAQASALGIGVRMALFVQGRFVPTPIDVQALSVVIAEELGQPLPPAATAVPREIELGTARPVPLPWSLDFVIPSRAGGAAFAGIRTSRASAPAYFAEGDEIEPGIELVQVLPRRVYLRRDGSLETLALTETPAPLPPGPLPPVPASALPRPDRVVTLERAQVRETLNDTARLERALALSDARFSGRQLVVIETVEPGGLLEMLGLEPDDVLVTVDGEFVTDRPDPLWNAVRERDEVVLVFMRRGLSKAVRVRIE
jgi:protein-disulfide isomerase/sulfur carrier protein ThiS